MLSNILCEGEFSYNLEVVGVVVVGVGVGGVVVVGGVGVEGWGGQGQEEISGYGGPLTQESQLEREE